MKQLLSVFICLTALVFCCYAGSLPTGSQTSSIPTPSSTSNFQMSLVLGQGSLNTSDTFDVSAYSIDDPYAISWVANSPIGSGLLVADYGYDRVLFFQNIQSANSSATKVLGQPDFVTDDYSILDDVYGVDSNAYGVYALNEDVVNFYSWTTINANAATLYPNTYFGNCSNCIYTSIGDSQSLVVKKSTGQVYIADNDCSRILIFGPNATANSEPVGVIGQPNGTLCDDQTVCSESLSTDCIYDPRALALDCYDGLWVYDYETDGIYHFANNSYTSDYGILPADNNEDWNDIYAITFSPDCSTLVVASQDDNEYIYFVTVSWNGATPTGASLAYAVGGGVDNAALSTTDSLYNIYGLTFAGNTLFAADEEYSRVVGIPLNYTVSTTTGATTTGVSTTGVTTTGVSTTGVTTTGATTTGVTTTTTSEGTTTTGGSSSTLKFWWNLF